MPMQGVKLMDPAESHREGLFEMTDPNSLYAKMADKSNESLSPVFQQASCKMQRGANMPAEQQRQFLQMAFRSQDDREKRRTEMTNKSQCEALESNGSGDSWPASRLRSVVVPAAHKSHWVSTNLDCQNYSDDDGYAQAELPPPAQIGKRQLHVRRCYSGYESDKSDKESQSQSVKKKNGHKDRPKNKQSLSRSEEDGDQTCRLQRNRRGDRDLSKNRLIKYLSGHADDGSRRNFHQSHEKQVHKLVRGHFKRRDASGDVNSKERNGKTSKFSGKKHTESRRSRFPSESDYSSSGTDNDEKPNDAGCRRCTENRSRRRYSSRSEKEDWSQSRDIDSDSSDDDDGRRKKVSFSSSDEDGSRKRRHPKRCSDSLSDDGDSYSDGRRRHSRRRSASRKPKSRQPRSQRDKKSSRGRQHDIKVGYYDGKSCLETFLARFQAASDYNGWRESDKIAHLKTSLVDGAGSLLWQLSHASYDDIVSKLRARYGTQEQQEKFRIELRYRTRKQGESLQELSQDIERLTMLAYPGIPSDMRDVLARDSFIESLDGRNLTLRVREKEPKTLAEALTYCMKLETIYAASDQQRDQARPRLVRAAQVNAAHLPPQPEMHPSFENKFYVDGTNQNKQSASRGSRRERGRMITTAAAEAVTLPVKGAQDQEREVVAALRKQVEELKLQLASITVSECAPPPVQTPPPQYGYQPQLLAGGQGYSPAKYWNQAGKPPDRLWNGHEAAPGPGWNQTAGMQNTAIKPITCFRCNEPGHMARNCPNRARTSKCNSSNEQLPEQACRASQGNQETPCYLKIKVDNKCHLALLDTGCSTTLIPGKLARRHELKKSERKCTAANGSNIPIKGEVDLPVVIGSVQTVITGLVTDFVSEVMISLEWLKENHACWNFSSGTVNINGIKHRLVGKKFPTTMCRRVILSEDVRVPAKCQLDVPTQLLFDRLPTIDDDKTDYATESTELQPGLLVARTMLPKRLVSLPVRVLNTLDCPVDLARHTVVSEAVPLTAAGVPTMNAPSKGSDGEMESIIDGLVSGADESVSDDVKQSLREMLRKYSDVLSRNDLDLGWCDVVVHQIDTGTHKPFRQTMRRYPPAHLRTIDDGLDGMLKQGVIEPTSSPWASNIVLARKKDGSYRVCIDYRQLNELTKKDAYPLPRTDECFDALSGSCLFSTFDLRSGYYQLALNPNDSEKTAFITRRGMFKFRTMPFGLCNAVSSFQRAMDLVLNGLNLETLLCYLDDIVVFSRTPEEHLERLECLLQRLKDANLKLKPSKCQLFQRRVSFLGHVVSAEGIQTDPEKIRLIAEWPAPRTLKEVRGFLGLTGYYRRFIYGYSEIVSPLHALMKKNRAFAWSDECQASFEELKKRLQGPPILALPNEEGVFLLDTDASDFCIGAVLSQLQDGQERVVSYAGRALSANERNYCITRKELLAVVYYLKYFKQYLLGHKFIVRTDHAALTWLRRTPEPIGQNARWLEQLEEYTFEVQHRPGARHGNADAMSRRPCLNKPSCTACHDVVARATTADPVDSTGARPDPGSERKETGEMLLGPHVRTSVLRDGPADQPIGWTKEEIAAAQRDDPEIQFIIGLKEKYTEKPAWKVVEGQSAAVKTLWHEFCRLEFHGEVLCRRWTPVYGPNVTLQVIIPRKLRDDFIRLVHSGLTGGHLGRSKTEHQLQRRAYWPGWRDDVMSAVKRCKDCASYHRGSAPKQTPLQPFVAGEPFEIISIDVTGKHPKSYQGNEYIVTIVDLFSKWSEAVPVKNHTAPVVAKVLMDHVVYRMGTPLRILSDQGREFQSLLFQELCERLDIDKIRTSPYQPSTNGVCERFHKTLNSMLAKVIAENQRDWDTKLPAVMAAYRAARHSSTGFSPNLLVLGRENRAPVDLVLGPIFEDTEGSNNRTYDEYVDDQLCVYQEAHRLAREHLGTAAERRKVGYDLRVKSKSFQKGDWVWYLYPRRYQQRSPKWSKQYTGPYHVVKVIPPCDYVLQKSKRSQPFVVHGNKLKLCRGLTSTSLLESSCNEPGDLEGPEEPVANADVTTKKPVRRRFNRRRDMNQPGELREVEHKRLRRPPRWLDDYQV